MTTPAAPDGLDTAAPDGLDTAAPDGLDTAAPDGLDTAGRALWRSIAGPYDLRPDELAVLARACAVTDRVAMLDADLAARIEADPIGALVSKGSMGQEVEAPVLASLARHEALLQRLLASLKLPDEPGGEKPNQHREAGKARWAVRTA